MDIASRIEHTNLSPTLTISDIDTLVNEAREFGFFGVCVPPFWVKRAKREIGQDKISLITVAGFPLGYNMTETKVSEIRHAIDNGADEIDVVWNLTSFRTGLPWTKIELAKCGKECHDRQKTFKVIIETVYLSDAEIVKACKICADAGADFIKTSTGYASVGATIGQIRLMRTELPSSVGIVAFEELKNREHALAMIDAGADRLGTSTAIKILNSE